MRVFVTGATGFIGSAIVQELLSADHQVLGLARGAAGAQALRAAGAQVHQGSLEDQESLRSGAAAADAVIHCAFIHDFSKYKENCEIDRSAIKALGSALIGSDKLLIVTSGTSMSQSGPGVPVTENDINASSEVIPRAATEEAAEFLADLGVRVAVMRLPQVHDTARQGLVTYAIQIAREKGVAAYIGDGLNRMPAAHRFDVSRLYRLALERGEGDIRYHAVAEEGVPAREIAIAIGQGLNVPVTSIALEAAPAHFGWLAPFAAWDIPASSVQTREQLGWNPTGPTLLSDLGKMNFSLE